MSRRALPMVVLMLLPALPALGGTHRFAVVVGNNLGHDPAQQLRYAEDDARKLHDVLVDLGEFDAGDVELLLAADAAAVRRALKRVEQRMARRSRETGARTLLVFYFSGHAEAGVLELGRSSLEFAELTRFLESSQSDVRLAFLDSCESGKIISLKGGRRGPEYEIRVEDEVSSKGYAIITSSAHDEMSQESAEIRGAYFTHYLVSALRGAGDESGDGKVTMGEAYQYAYARTLARTATTMAGSQHPMYHFRLEGRGEIVLTRTDRSGARIAVEVARAGRLVLVDGDGESMVAETEVDAGRTAVLAVRPGEYRAYLIDGAGAVSVAAATVPAGNKTVLGRAERRVGPLPGPEPPGAGGDRTFHLEHPRRRGRLHRVQRHRHPDRRGLPVRAAVDRDPLGGAGGARVHVPGRDRRAARHVRLVLSRIRRAGAADERAVRRPGRGRGRPDVQDRGQGAGAPAGLPDGSQPGMALDSINRGRRHAAPRGGYR
jgi:uncharacterized caspase-like protein